MVARMYQWEWVFANDGERKYSVLLEMSIKRILLGIGLEHWSDWSGFMLYLGPLAIGIGVQHKLGY